MTKALELTTYPHGRLGGYTVPLHVWSPASCVPEDLYQVTVSEDDLHGRIESKRFTDAELAAEVHAFVMTDHKYPADPDEYGDEEWEAYSREYQEAEKTMLRFATLPHHDEAS